MIYNLWPFILGFFSGFFAFGAAVLSLAENNTIDKNPEKIKKQNNQKQIKKINRRYSNKFDFTFSKKNLDLNEASKAMLPVLEKAFQNGIFKETVFLDGKYLVEVEFIMSFTEKNKNE